MYVMLEMLFVPNFSRRSTCFSLYKYSILLFLSVYMNVRNFLCYTMLKVLELWTKRNFRCDCGNSKFREFSCKLSPNKDVENIENSYNHNFNGLYCTCNRPYPDPDLQEQEEMIQCCMCEDWFHEEHISLSSPNEVGKLGRGAYTPFLYHCFFFTSFCQRHNILVSLLKLLANL